MELRNSVQRWTMSHRARRFAWMIVWRAFGSPGPRWLSAWRAFLLKLFGARIGEATLICGGVDVLMPWNLTIGNGVAIGEGVNIYNFAEVRIGDDTCISQGVWLCTGTHDYERSSFPLQWRPIRVGASVWIAAEAFIHPGVVIHDGVVVGARSVVAHSLDAWGVYAGNPCRLIKPRTLLR